MEGHQPAFLTPSHKQLLSEQFGGSHMPWGVPHFPLLQCTKQLLSERFGRGSRTVDLELETQIELLRETKRKYESVLHLARALTAHLYSLVQTQHALGDAFADLSQKSPELQVCQG